VPKQQSQAKSFGFRSTVAALLLVSALAGCRAGGQPPTPAPVAGARPTGVYVSLNYKNPAELNRAVEGGLDVFGADVDRQQAYGRIARQDFDRLRAAGLALRLERADAPGMGVRNSFDKGYRTYEQVKQELHVWADQHPKLMKLSSAGPSWETTQGKAERQLWTVRLTGPGDASKRPAVAFTANVHARELVPVEMAMSLIQDLLQGYDTNPEIKRLLDTRVVYVLPMANPDGHHRAEKGDDWRKNTHTFTGGIGVDLNRNFPFKWGLGNGGSSLRPSSDTYQGPEAASEPETQAVIRFLSTIPNLKIGMDYHAYSNLIMWPWGWTANPAPDAKMLETIGRKLASFNKYKPIQASSLYPTCGTIRDFVYGELKVPYFTTEIGGRMDGFDPSFKRAQALIAENKPGAMYLISIADNPAQVLPAMRAGR
jgi:carboxypeptidase T